MSEATAASTSETDDQAETVWFVEYSATNGDNYPVAAFRTLDDARAFVLDESEQYDTEQVPGTDREVFVGDYGEQFVFNVTDVPLRGEP